jgi:PLP dependent protein
VTASATEVAARLERVHERVRRAGGRGVRILAVTKGFGPDAVVAATEAGADGVGESYAQELCTKADALAAQGAHQPAWHFIGRLQRNKVRALAGHVAVWQSVDRHELALEIARRQPGAAVLVQVNASDEPQKGGCAFADVPALVAGAGELGLDVRGLMAVGPTGPPEAAREPFRRVVELADRLGLPERSLGMSDDLEVAVSAGSTMVRIGRDLFGPRPAPAARAAGRGGAGR